MMKQFLIPILFLLLGNPMLSAQTQKGHFALGLNNFHPANNSSFDYYFPAVSNAFGIAFERNNYYYTDKTKNTSSKTANKSYTISLSGSAKYFVLDNLSAGINLFGSTSTVRQDTFLGKRSQVLAGPEVRYYIPVSSKIKCWLSAEYATGLGRDEDQKEVKAPSYLRRMLGQAGLGLFLNPNFSLDASFGYGRYRIAHTYYYQNVLYHDKFFEKFYQFTLGVTGYF